jgi:DNA segregation ATPase FtsK/SpoIIIE-like protein
MNRKEQKYQRLVQSLPYYGKTERFSINGIQRKLKVGFPWAKDFHDRLFHEAWIDSEDHKADCSFPYGICIDELKRSKRYCGTGFPYPLPLGETPTGERHHYALNDLGSLLLLADDGCGKMNALRVILTSLVIGGSINKPDFLFIDTKRVQLAPYEALVHHRVPTLKESDEAIASLEKLFEEKKQRKTPLVVIINEISDLLEASNQFLGLCQRLAGEGGSKNLYLIAATQRNLSEAGGDSLKNAFPSIMALHYGGKEATLIRQGKEDEDLIVPTLSEKECLATLKAIKEKRRKK